MIFDSEEAWQLNILGSDPKGTSAIWVAQKLQNDHVTSTANMFTIREINLKDNDYFLGTP